MDVEEKGEQIWAHFYIKDQVTVDEIARYMDRPVVIEVLAPTNAHGLRRYHRREAEGLLKNNIGTSFKRFASAWDTIHRDIGERPPDLIVDELPLGLIAVGTEEKVIVEATSSSIASALEYATIGLTIAIDI